MGKALALTTRGRCIALEVAEAEADMVGKAGGGAAAAAARV